MPKRISVDELYELLQKDQTTEADLKPYVVAAKSRLHGFSPTLLPNPETVETEEFETAFLMNAFNGFSKRGRHRRYRRKIKNGWSGLKIVSEGDSWFQYPILLEDIIDHLSDEYAIYSLGSAGDLLQEIIDEDEITDAIARENPDVFLISGGGNDMVGRGRMATMVQRFDENLTAEEYPNHKFNDFLKEITSLYHTLVDKLLTRHGTLKIVTHGYDRAIPDNGKWLGKPLKKRGVIDESLQREIVAIMIDRFNEAMQNVAQDYPSRVFHTDCRGSVADNRWHDELHPTNEGYEDAAKVFRATINAAVSGQRLPETVSRQSGKRSVLPEGMLLPKRSKKKSRVYRNQRKAAPSPAEFIADPRKVNGFDQFNKVLKHGYPDPIRGGRKFRVKTGDPTATFMMEMGGEREIVHEAHVGESIDFLPAIFLQQGAERARTVGRIVIERGTDYKGRFISGGWLGTGFLVAPNILLTNHHVINSKDVARQGLAEFNYRIGNDGYPEEHLEFQFLPDELFVTNAALDFTFVAIEPGAAAQFGHVDLTRRMYPVEINQRANIVQHPNGRPKEVVLHKNLVVADTGTLLHYHSDTEGGSSGSPVFSDDWEVVALHHATTKIAGSTANEGIKISAIAADLEYRATVDRPDRAHSQAVLTAINGIDSAFGFFGALGRTPKRQGEGLERVVDLYQGGDQDIDVAAWNIEWFSNRYQSKLDDVAVVIADFNVDIWALSESSPEAAEALVEKLKDEFGLNYAVAHSEPNASTGKQSTSVLWNKDTVKGKRVGWPNEINAMFDTHSRDFDDLGLEAVHGKIFNRYPALYYFEPKSSSSNEPSFFLIPVHLKAKSEGSIRRDMASKILVEAVERMKQIDSDADRDFVILGDFNATLGSGDFDALTDSGFDALTAEDEENGGLTYLKGRYRSLIDHIFLSPNMAPNYDNDDMFIVAVDNEIPNYISSISDHRPIVARLSIKNEMLGNEDSISGSISNSQNLEDYEKLLGAIENLCTAYKNIQ